MVKRKREDKLEMALKSTIIAVVVLILVSVTALVFSHYLDLHRARVALYQAKTVRLAAWSVSAECYATGRNFADQSTENGFAIGVADEIKEMSLCPGEVNLVQVSKDGYGIEKLVYIQDSYTVEYLSDDNTGTWQVFKSSVLITS